MYTYHSACIKILKKIIMNFFSQFFRAIEVKEHPFFRGIDWTQVYLQKYQPPLIPPRGEVNAADAFDIGSFDEEDTKGIKVNTCVINDMMLKPHILILLTTLVDSINS